MAPLLPLIMFIFLEGHDVQSQIGWTVSGEEAGNDGQSGQLVSNSFNGNSCLSENI